MSLDVLECVLVRKARECVLHVCVSMCAYVSVCVCVCVCASTILIVVWTASDDLTGFHEPLSPPYRCHTVLKSV